MEEESENEIEFDLMLWSDEMLEDAIYDHSQFTGTPRGPVQPVRTLIIRLYLTSDIMKLIVNETEYSSQKASAQLCRAGIRLTVLNFLAL